MSSNFKKYARKLKLLSFEYSPKSENFKNKKIKVFLQFRILYEFYNFSFSKFSGLRLEMGNYITLKLKAIFNYFSAKVDFSTLLIS